MGLSDSHQNYHPEKRKIYQTRNHDQLHVFLIKKYYPDAKAAFTCHQFGNEHLDTIPWYVTTLYDTACKLFHTTNIMGIFRYGKRDFPFQLLRNDIFLSRNSIIIVIYGKEVVRITL